MKTFKDMLLPQELAQALRDLKFEEPTKIQSAVIPVATQGHDLIACAETGSGKTAAFSLPMAVSLLENPGQNALILAPTRELAHQISEFLRILTAHSKELQIATLVGGSDMKRQFRALKRRPRIVVATPGRLNDHLRRGSLKLNTTHTLILDEGDRMIDMGFAPQLEEILKFLPNKRQTSLFTATMTPKVRKLAESYLNKPQSINVGVPSQPVSTVKQSIVQLNMHDKNDKILDEINKRKGSIIVFARTQRRTDDLARFLNQYGLKIDLIHGGRSQGQRNQAIRSFKSGKSRILCATDIAARGLDIPQVEHVINFDLPTMDEDYVHRIGRTARNGAEGEAITFVTPSEHRTWKVLSQKYKIKGVELTPVKGKNPKYKDPKKGSFRSKAGGRKPRFRSEDGSERRSEKRSEHRSEGRSEKRSEGRPGRRTEGRSEGRPAKRSNARSDKPTGERKGAKKDDQPSERSRVSVRSKISKASKSSQVARSVEGSEKRPSKFKDGKPGKFSKAASSAKSSRSAKAGKTSRSGPSAKVGKFGKPVGRPGKKTSQRRSEARA